MPEFVKVPDYEVLVDGKDISGLLRSRLVSLSITDKRGFEADTASVTIDDADGKVAIPPRGAKMQVSIGWKGEPLYSKGTFFIDDVEHTGPPDQLTIRGKSADIAGSFQELREESYHEKTLGDILDAVAGRNKISALIADELASKAIAHMDQQNESDMAFMTRLGEEFDALATIKEGKLLFMPNGQGKSGSGQALPPFTIRRSSGDTHTFTANDRSEYTGVIARWQDERAAEIKTDEKDGAPTQFLAGSEGNVKVLRHLYATESNAKRAAEAQWSKMKRSGAKFTMSLAVGEPGLFPEVPVTVQGWKPEIDQAKWITEQVSHEISDSGLTSSVSLESLKD
ncbi:phage late control D family protein [Idiomarina abyssalis]|uniref:phage late control D family protein n=1 Tax=Idiomarina abyssalis TaxID=86102 RepID=UPI001CD78FD2|nr:phage late control D family protein [Idiomarina abyssalis]